jgi:hypothetical protein
MIVDQAKMPIQNAPQNKEVGLIIGVTRTTRLELHPSKEKLTEKILIQLETLVNMPRPKNLLRHLLLKHSPLMNT